RVLEKLNWEKKYHYVRIGPGKAIGFGMVDRKPVFCLPGGPPSNHISFLQLALPGLLRLAGWETPELPRATVELTEEIQGQIDWTQFLHGRLIKGDDIVKFAPSEFKSRLQMMATSQAIVKIPEGIASIPAGTLVKAHLLN
ncbi:MAG TPA: molybdopterin molybdenumtransferase MoeA, partial [Chloroflexi bacterium]|nr:molybdopterin molybdenumtransferase MoeA [Chloroflexota bacterium]